MPLHCDTGGSLNLRESSTHVSAVASCSVGGRSAGSGWKLSHSLGEGGDNARERLARSLGEGGER